MLKGNCQKKNLTTCERKTSLYKPVLTSICEKKISAEVRLIHAEQISLHNFIVLRKNSRHS